MKKIILLIVCLFFFSVPFIKAQYCNTNKGTVLYYETIDTEHHNKEIIDTTCVIDVLDKGDCLAVKYSKSPYTPVEKDESVLTYIFDKQHTTYMVVIDAKEENERRKMIMSSFYPEERKADADKDFQKSLKVMRADGMIRIPLSADVKKGDEIPACSYVYKIGFLKMSLALNGKYEGFETIDTSAGEFKCLKVGYTVKTKMMLGSDTYHVTEWYAEGVGLVKTIATTNKGKIKYSSVLTSIEQK